MNCHWMREHLPAYAEGELGALRSVGARLHLQTCSSCFDRYERYAGLTSPVARLAPVAPPPDLNLKIRLEVSRQALRRSWLEETWTSLQVSLQDAMRPLALRGGGALLAAGLLFGALMSDLFGVRVLGPDVPLTSYLVRGLVSAPTIVELAPYPVSVDTTVLASVDMEGGIYDFQLPDDQRDNAKLRAEVANALLFAEVQPAMVFGHPVPGRLLIAFTRYTVRG